MDKCMDNWKYKELDSTIEVKILLFIPAHHTHILFRPNFAFCVYHDKDTFAAIIDYHYDLSNRIKDGDKITLISPQWNNYKNSFIHLKLYLIFQKRIHIIAQLKRFIMRA